MNKPYPLYNVCEAYSTIKETVVERAKVLGDQIAYSYREKPNDKKKLSVSYREFSEQVKAFGTELLSRNIGRGRCAVIGKLSYSWVLTYFSVLSIGSVLVPLDPDWTSEDLLDALKKSNVDMVICDIDVADKIADYFTERDIKPVFTKKTDGECVLDLVDLGRKRVESGDNSFDFVESDPEEMSLLVFTSGTTGQGKGVMLSEKAILVTVSEGMKLVKIGNKMIAVLPPHHTFGSTISILGGYYLGIEVYISNGIRYFQHELQQERPEGLILVPLFLETFAKKIMANVKEQGKEKVLNGLVKVSNVMRKVGINFTKQMFSTVLKAFGGNLKYVIVGGAPLSAEVYNFFSSFGIKVINGYGITECSPLISVNRNDHIVPGTVGMPIKCDTIKIDNPNEDGEGEICVKGPNVMLGYYQNEEATKAVIDDEGFFHTGDIGKIHESGYLIITGRIKNLIILSNGKNVYPEEIECTLSSVPGLSDIVVYEGVSKRGIEHNTIVAEVWIEPEAREKLGIDDVEAYIKPYIHKYNLTAVSYKKIGMLKVRNEPFPKNTLKKIVRFKIDKTID